MKRNCLPIDEWDIDELCLVQFHWESNRAQVAWSVLNTDFSAQKAKRQYIIKAFYNHAAATRKKSNW
jgi:hypothetical protein